MFPSLRVSDLQLCGGAPGRGLLSNNEDGSSLSDVSAISNLSNKVTSDWTLTNIFWSLPNIFPQTYVTEESSLVLEVYERGRLHHYLIPHQVCRYLHIYISTYLRTYLRIYNVTNIHVPHTGRQPGQVPEARDEAARVHGPRVYRPAHQAVSAVTGLELSTRQLAKSH